MTKFTSEAQPPLSTTVSGEPQQNLLPLTFGCIGVVYGDIGTSPLYAFREAVHAAQDTGPLTQTTVLGVLSLISPIGRAYRGNGELTVDISPQREGTACMPT
jgi:hypothetical protein